jgi:hypothetical protein
MKHILPNAATLLEQGPDWFRYRTINPSETNPLVIQALVNRNFPVVGLSEVPRSLEKVYLHAISTVGNEVLPHEFAERELPNGEPRHVG